MDRGVRKVGPGRLDCKWHRTVIGVGLQISKSKEKTRGKERKWEGKTSSKAGRKAKRRADTQEDEQTEEFCPTVNFEGLKIGCRPSGLSSRTPLSKGTPED